MPVAGLQDVGHAAVATGSGVLKLRSFVKADFAFLIKKIRPRQINDRDALNARFHSAWKVLAFPLDAYNAGDASGLLILSAQHSKGHFHITEAQIIYSR